MNRRTALITGASSGIGREFAEIFARDSYNLVVVARSRNNLDALKEELQAKYNIKVFVIAMDLTTENAAKKIKEILDNEGIIVDYLINNAGFGYMCAFADSDWEKQKSLIDLNITTMTEMTYVFARDMKGRGFGKILNVSSVAGFCAGTNVATYYASKAYVLNFSQAVNYELKGSGVTITTLCPPPTDTNFDKVANMDKSKSFLFVSDAKKVAESGYKALMKNKTFRFYGIMTNMGNIFSRLTPRCMHTWYTARLSKSRQTKQKKL